jgi:hypothetical protein
MKRAFLIGLLAACGSKSAQAPAPAPAPAPVTPAHAPADAPAAAAAARAPIVWSIDCAPSTVSMAQRKSVMITIHATNTTAAVRDPKRDPLDFVIDGTSSMELALAFGNGGRLQTWEAIPPGETVTDRRTGMDLVAAPGDHVIAMTHGGVELARTTLHVTP